jgi:ABC-type branched-subunit amino acid transport system ATPase component
MIFSVAEAGTSLRSACGVLVDWANEQDRWVRRVVEEVLATRQELPESALEPIYRLLLAEKGLTPGPAEDVPLLVATEAEAELLEPFRLTRLADLEGVNALEPGQEIRFNGKLTVLFGENACGKTGYVRVLKSVAGVRATEPVLGDVRDEVSKPQRASLSYRIGDGDEETYDWTGASGVSPFTRMTVFDTVAVAIHVDEDLTYTYTPRDVALFRHVADAIDAVRGRLERAQVEARSTGNPFLHRFDRDASAYAKVSVLDATTDLAELRSLADVTAEEEEGLAGLRQRVDALRPEGAQTQLQLTRSQLALLRSIESVTGAVETFDADGYNASRITVMKAEEAHREVNERAFAADGIPGVPGDAWRELIEAAERYIVETHSDGYPEAGDLCVYCRQGLGDSAIRLVQKYRAVAGDTTKQVAADARRDLESLQRSAEGIDVVGAEGEVSRNLSVLDGRKALLAAARSFFPAATAALGTIRSGEQVEFAGARITAEALGRDVKAAADAAEAIIANLTAKAEERQRLHAEASKNLRDLESRILLRQLLPDIELYVGRARWAARAETAGSRITPLLKSLTEAAKTASESLLNQDFEARFREECKALRAPTVKLQFPGKRGEPARRKSIVPQHRLSEILSEGEQKVIALADFLAESRLRRTSATVVLDDPVTSLDYRRLEHVVDRIAQLADDQQVIVFTHNIWFTALLLDRFEKGRGDIAYYDVKTDEGKIGVVSASTSPRVDTPSKIEAKLNALLQDISKVSGETREALLERGYELIRNWCEAFAEHELLQGVARRYEPNVRVNSLKNIKTDRLDATIGVVVPLYDKACRMILGHSQPLETLSVRPTLTELKEDWQALLEARSAHVKN